MHDAMDGMYDDMDRVMTAVDEGEVGDVVDAHLMDAVSDVLGRLPWPDGMPAPSAEDALKRAHAAACLGHARGFVLSLCRQAVEVAFDG